MVHSSKRIFLFDNVKALLITLVVLGHAIDYYTKESDIMRASFFYIYMFHMPLFIFIAGLFSKSTVNAPKLRFDKIAYFLILYLLFEILYYFVLNSWFGDTRYLFNPLIEDDVPWFLLAMVIWLLLARAIKHMNKPFIFISSIILAVLIGYTNIGDFLVLSRVFVFLPFFLAGLYMNPQKIIQQLQFVSKRYLFIFTLILSSIIIFLSIQKLYSFRGLLTGRNPYEYIIGLADMSLLEVGLARFTLFIVTILLCIAILAIMPDKETWFTLIGERSLAIYFFHNFILLIYHHYEVNTKLASVFPTAWLAIYFLTFLAVVVLLTWKPFELTLRSIEKVLSKIFKTKKVVLSKSTI